MIHLGNIGIYLYIKDYYFMTYIKYIKRNTYNQAFKESLKMSL